MRIVFMRGIPGSGKTTHLSRLTSKDSVICSADHHFMVNGRYRYNAHELPIAQQRCLRKFIDTLNGESGPHQRLIDVVAVDNTNIRALDLAPYVAIARAFGLKPEIINVWCDPDHAHQRCCHGVPAGTIHRMAQSMQAERLPPWWWSTDATIIDVNAGM